MSCFQCLLHLRAFFKNEPRIKTDLALIYKRRFEHSIFYDTCVSTLRYLTRQSNNPQGLTEEQQEQQPFERKSTRKSAQSVSHYENAVVNFTEVGTSSQHHSPSFGSGQIPNTLSYMSITEKQDLLKQLIEKSYVFVDLSDLFSGQDLETYENIVRQEVFEGEESIVESILETNNRRGVRNRLKYFDTEALHLLNIYVSFCEKMKLKLLMQQGVVYKGSSKDFFLCRLILQLKARLQLEFPSQKITSPAHLTQLISEYKILTDIILCTLQKTESIRIIPEDSHQYAQNFFTYPNITTLVSVILFMDENFLKAIFERFLQGLKVYIDRMGEKLIVIEKVFVDKLKGEYFGVGDNKTKSSSSTEDLFTYKSNLHKILQGGAQIKFPYFRKSLRTLQTLTTQREPIKCLKIIYELNKTIEKEHTQLINQLISQQAESQSQIIEVKQNRLSRSAEMRKSQKAKKYSFSRETERMIIEFLLARKKDRLKFIVTNIMITHCFVHQSQLRDKKGSCLAPFVEIIKNTGFGMQFQWPF